MSEASKPDLVTINVNGDPYDVPGGMNLIDAVKQYANIEIPHYCYHSKLSIAGNCRMCLVEMGMPMRDRGTGEPILEADGSPKIGWMPKPAIACSTKTSPGLHIKTNSPMVEECRNGVMEFLLVNHPLDCPICDQAGECRLQQFATDYGRGYSRYIEPKNVKPKRSRIGPRITLDDERCVLCSRCVRFSQEITKDGVLGFVDRGSYSTLTCYPGRELDNNYSLNVVDICPVGALTDNDFRFKMRVWFLKPVKSICTESSVGVNTQVWSREGVIYRITPRQNDFVNDTWMSDSGRRLYKTAEAENRLSGASIDGSSVDIAQAVKKATEVLSEGSVGIVLNGHASLEEQFLISKIGKTLQDKGDSISSHLIGHYDKGDEFLISNDRTPNNRGALLTSLTKKPAEKTVASVEHRILNEGAKSLLVFGEDLIGSGLDKSVIDKVNVIYFGTHENETSKAASVVIPIPSVFEKAGSFVNQAFRLQKFEKAIPAPAGVVDSLVVLTDLVNSVGDEAIGGTLALVWDKMSSEVSELAGLSYKSLGDLGVELDSSQYANIEFAEGKTLHFEGAASMKGATLA